METLQRELKYYKDLSKSLKRRQNAIKSPTSQSGPHSAGGNYESRQAINSVM